MYTSLTIVYLYIMTVFSHLQIFYNTYVSKHLNMLKSYLYEEEDDVKLEYIYIKDGKEISRTRNTNIVIDKCNDYIVIKKEKYEDKKYFGQILVNKNIDEEKKDIIDNNFMSITLTYDNNEYDINLDNPINFNIDGNIVLDNVFTIWYMKEKYDIELQKGEPYIIKIMDNNIIFHTINEKSGIKLTKDTYTIIDNYNEK